MAYLRHYQAKGDPFLGGLFKLAKGVVGKGLKLAGIGGGPSASSIAEKLAQRMGSMPGVGAVKGIASKAISKVPGGAKGAAVAAAAAAAGLTVGEYLAQTGQRRSYRRMNPGNVRALRRSMRRVQSFAKLARSTMSFVKTHRLKKRGKR